MSPTNSLTHYFSEESRRNRAISRLHDLATDRAFTNESCQVEFKTLAKYARDMTVKHGAHPDAAKALIDTIRYIGENSSSFTSAHKLAEDIAQTAFNQRTRSSREAAAADDQQLALLHANKPRDAGYTRLEKAAARLWFEYFVANYEADLTNAADDDAILSDGSNLAAHGAKIFYYAEAHRIIFASHQSYYLMTAAGSVNIDDDEAPVAPAAPKSTRAAQIPVAPI